MIPAISPTDSLWPTSPNTGNPACLCSRCGRMIGAGEAIRIFPEHGTGEYRYHPACFGLVAAEVSYPDEEDEEEHGP